MPEILDEATTFLSRIWEGGLGDVIRESLESSGSNVSAIETSKTLAKTKRTFDDYMNQLNTVLIERGNTQMILDTALKARQVQHKAVTVIQSKIESIISLKMVPGVSEAGHARETWGNMSDADVRSNEERLTRLRAEKNSMKADIIDRKDSIENQTEILESYQNTILGIVSTMLSEANAGTANHAAVASTIPPIVERFRCAWIIFACMRAHRSLSLRNNNI